MNTLNTLPNFTQYGYQVIQQLGHNGDGRRFTYLAVHQNSQQQVVIKEFCFARRGSNWAGYDAHEREIQVLQHLNHPRIPRYLNSFETEYGFCLVQEYKDAPSLAQRNDFNPEEIQKLAISVLEILTNLQARNQPVFHRDIKPENILVDRDLNVYLIDFGLAQIESNSGEVSTCTAGTFGFMPHEQLYNQTLTKASDLYSFGVTLICLLTKTSSSEIGQLISPKSGFNFAQKTPPLHPDFVRWLKKIVAPDAKERFPDAETALHKLKSIRIEGLSLSEKLGNGIKNTSKVLFGKRVIHSVVAIAILGGLGWGLNVNRQNEIKRQEIAKQQQIKEIEEQKRQEKERKRKKAEEKRKEATLIAQEQRKKAARIAEEQLQKKRNQNVNILVATRKCIGCDLRNIDLSETKLQGVNLQGANLEGANLSFSYFNNANLKGVNLKNANLYHTNFSGADLEGTNLEGTDLKHTKLNGAKNLDKATMPY